MIDLTELLARSLKGGAKKASGSSAVSGKLAAKKWAELLTAGYASLVHGQKTWNGVAILGRGTEPLEIRRGLPGDSEASRRATWKQPSEAS